MQETAALSAESCLELITDEMTAIVVGIPVFGLPACTRCDDNIVLIPDFPTEFASKETIPPCCLRDFPCEFSPISAFPIRAVVRSIINAHVGKILFHFFEF